MANKTVFLGSVSAGLETYRAAVYQAIEGLSGYHCTRMEDFGTSGELPLLICLEKVRSADIFVGIIGHRYGSCPPGTAKSYCELEYEAAREAGMVCLMFIAPEEFPIQANLIETDEQREKQRRLRDRISSERLTGRFRTEEDLATKVIQAIHNERERLVRDETTSPAVLTGSDAERTSVLLFPFVTNSQGFDTGISIANTTADPLGTEPVAGTCTVYYYGRALGTGAAQPDPQVSGVILPGEQLLIVLSTGSNNLINATPGFQGYLIVECRFPHAHGFAFVSDGPIGAARVASSYLATRIKPRRDD